MLMITSTPSTTGPRSTQRRRAPADEAASVLQAGETSEAPTVEQAAPETPRRRKTDQQPAAPQAPSRRFRGAFAPLVAQLIATRMEAPQTRNRRRGSFEDAAEAYTAARRPATASTLATA